MGFCFIQAREKVPYTACGKCMRVSCGIGTVLFWVILHFLSHTFKVTSRPLYVTHKMASQCHFMLIERLIFLSSRADSVDYSISDRGDRVSLGDVYGFLFKFAFGFEESQGAGAVYGVRHPSDGHFHHSLHHQLHHHHDSQQRL